MFSWICEQRLLLAQVFRYKLVIRFFAWSVCRVCILSMTILSKKKAHNKTEEKADSSHQANHNHGISLNSIPPHPQVLNLRETCLLFLFSILALLKMKWCFRWVHAYLELVEFHTFLMVRRKCRVPSEASLLHSRMQSALDLILIVTLRLLQSNSWLFA